MENENSQNHLNQQNNQKGKISEDKKDNNPLPDFINFLVIMDCSFPKSPPKILSKTKVKKLIFYNV